MTNRTSVASTVRGEARKRTKPRNDSPQRLIAPLALSCVLALVPLAIDLAAQNGDDPNDTAPAAPAADDLDAQLLEDLGGDLFGEDVSEPSNGPASTAPNDDVRSDDDRNELSELDEDLLKSLGEDLGQSSPDDDPAEPLERIGSRMRSAQELLANKDASGRTTRLQDQIVEDLEALIKKVQRQKKQSQQGGKPSPGSQRSDAQPQGGEAGQATGTGEQPAADSTDELRDTGSGGGSADRDAVQDLLKNQWGHLPEREREQMLESWSDEFLPKYELEIEQYFRRLAEDPELGGR